MLQKKKAVSFHENLSMSLCPASSSIFDPNDSNGNHMYPISSYGSCLEQKLHNVELTDCYAWDSVSNNVSLHQCPTKERICPMIAENMEDALSAMKNRTSSSAFCQVHESLQKPAETVRFIVLGGSVTAGRNTEGCCSKPECNGKLYLKRCAWPQYFGNWLNNTFPADVETYNLAVSGYTSIAMSEEVTERLQAAGIANLTSNDVVFLDHSVNDDGVGAGIVASLTTGECISVRDSTRFKLTNYH